MGSCVAVAVGVGAGDGGGEGDEGITVGDGEPVGGGGEVAGSDQLTATVPPPGPIVIGALPGCALRAGDVDGHGHLLPGRDGPAAAAQRDVGR